MKKSLIYVLIIGLLLILSSCSSLFEPNNTASVPKTTSYTPISTYKSTYTSSSNGEQPYNYMSELEVTGDNGKWDIDCYVDDFGNDTSNKYIYTNTTGTFTNSATNGSNLSVKILCNKNTMSINLLEYGRYPLSLIEDYPKIEMKINYDGQTKEFTGLQYDSSTKRIVINDTYNVRRLYQAFVENPKVKMLITIKDYNTSTYLFEINTAGFEYTYQQAFVPPKYSKPNELNIDENGTLIECLDKAGKSITIPDNVTSIGTGAFKGCIYLETVIIPDSVTSIGALAFQDCRSLKNINIPNEITVIDINTFAGCSSLESITLPDKITTIEMCAFGGCSSLKHINIPDYVKTIEFSTFVECTSLESITIPESVMEIKTWAFLDCSSLKSIYIDKEKYSLDLSNADIPSTATVYWKGEY